MLRESVVRRAWRTAYTSYRASYRCAPHLGVAYESAFQDAYSFLELFAPDDFPVGTWAYRLAGAAGDAFFDHRWGG